MTTPRRSALAPLRTRLRTCKCMRTRLAAGTHSRPPPSRYPRPGVAAVHLNICIYTVLSDIYAVCEERTGAAQATQPGGYRCLRTPRRPAR